MMKHTGKKWALKAVMLSSTVIIAPHAIAQDNDDDSLMEEIIITATKRSTNLNDTAAAVTALTSNFRDKTGLEGVQDIADFTPGMSAQDTPNQISIRGVGRLTNALGSDPGVALYLDGVYETETAIFGMGTLNVARTEVLRGPQGTLYGRNSIGGAVNIISKRPSKEWEGEVRASYGSYDAQMYGARISGPITDQFRILAWATKTKRDGYQKNVGIGSDKWSDDATAWEAQIEYDVTEKIQFWAKYGVSRWEADPRHVVKINDYDRTSLRGSLVHNVSLGYAEANPSVVDPFTIRSDYDGVVKLSNHHRAAAEFTYTGDNVNVKYLYGSQAYDYDESVDIDHTDRTDALIYPDPSGDPAAGYVVLPNQNINTLGEYKKWDSHEIQVSSSGDNAVDWIFGAYIYSEDISQPYALSSPSNIYLQNPRVFTLEAPSPFNAYMGFSWRDTGDNPDGNYYFQEGKLKAESKALFGEVTFDISEKLTVKAGLRYSKDKKTGYEDQRIIYDQMANSFDPASLAALYAGMDVGPAPVPTGAPYYQQFSVDFTGGVVSDIHNNEWSEITGNLAVEYRPNEDTLAYFTISKGYKSGGFRLGAISDDPATSVNEAEVGEEKLYAYELGLKQGLGDNAQLNMVAFYYDYKGLQSEVPVYRNGIPFVELYNADKARSMGFEAELIWHLSEGTTFTGNYSYMDAEYTDFCGDRSVTGPDGSTGCLVDATGAGVLYDPTGNSLNKAPKHKFAANLTHVFDMGAGDLSFSATYAYVGKQDHSIFKSAITQSPSYDRADARISWFDKDDRFEIHATGKNLFNTLAMSSVSLGSSPYFHQLASYNAPRTYTVELRVKF